MTVTNMMTIAWLSFSREQTLFWFCFVSFFSLLAHHYGKIATQLTLFLTRGVRKTLFWRLSLHPTLLVVEFPAFLQRRETLYPKENIKFKIFCFLKWSHIENSLRHTMDCIILKKVFRKRFMQFPHTHYCYISCLQTH